MNALMYLQRVVPAAGIVWNQLRFPGLRTGLRVEISGAGHLIYGKRVRVGEGTRIDLAPGAKLLVGDDVATGRAAYFSVGPGQRQSIGSRTNIQDGCRIYGPVAIGRGCIFAPNVFISAGSHTFDALPHLPISEQERITPSREREIRVLDDCWIGVNAVLMPGITIARGCVVGANAVVTTDLDPYSVAVGAPARTIRKRLDFSPPARIEATREVDLPYFYDGFELAPGQRAEHVCDGDFSLALKHPRPSVVRLCLSGDGSEIRHDDSALSMPRTPSVIEFPVRPDVDSSPLLRFHAVGRTRICWAELA
jgi:acetyltransferase-like isoleucine patch superfamily enzyme